MGFLGGLLVGWFLEELCEDVFGAGPAALFETGEGQQEGDVGFELGVWGGV